VRHLRPAHRIKLHPGIWRVTGYRFLAVRFLLYAAAAECADDPDVGRMRARTVSTVEEHLAVP